jgi:hypothetical protein
VVVAMDPDGNEDGMLEAARQQKALLDGRRAELVRELEQVDRRIKLCDHTIDEWTGRAGKKAGPAEEIVLFLRQNASETKPLHTPEIARGMGVKAQSLARRLKKMAEDDVIFGDKDNGYFAPPNAKR